MQPVKGAFRKVNITPEEAAPLQGYDPSKYIANPKTDILDDLYARVLVLDDGIKRNVIVSIDCCLTNETTFQAADPDGKPLIYRHLLQTFPEGTRRMWGSMAGVDEASVSVHATHTHSAPEHFSAKYTARIAQAIQEASENMRPLRVRAGKGETGVSVNRRPHLQPNDTLPVDKTLNVVVFDNEDGTPAGAIVNCAVHPTLLLNPAYRVSAEFVGLAAKAWEEETGSGFVAHFIQGFSGDVGPFGHYRDETDDTYPWVKRLGHELYEEIAAIAGKSEPIAALPFASAEQKVALPTREGYFKPSIDVTLQALRIGQLLLVSVSCEVFNGYAGIVRELSPAAYTLCAGVSNGYNGYLPTPEAFVDGLGGYEMNTTPYTLEAAEQFVQALKQLLASMN